MSETVIEWDRQRVIVANGQAVGKTAEFRKVSVLERPASGEDFREFAALLKPLMPAGTAKAPASVTVVLARQSVTIHRIQLPQVPDHEIPDMVRLQASMRLTVPVETVCLDYAPMPQVVGSSTRDVLLVTAPVDHINGIRKTLAACQVQLASVRVSSFCLAEAATDAGLLRTQSDPQVVDVMVLLRTDFIEVTFARGTSVVFSHSGASWTSADGIERAVRSELSRARMTASESLGDYKVGRVLLIGSPQITAAVTDQISARLDNAPIERIDPASTLIGGAIPEGISSEELVALAGAISAEHNKAVEAVDLVNPRKAPEKKDLRRAKVLGGILAAIVVIGLVWNWRQGQIQKFESQAGVIQAQVSELQETLKTGQPDLALAANIRNWVDRDIDWLDEMNRMKELLPGTDRLILKSCTFGVKQSETALGTVQIDGKAKSVPDVDSLARRLVEAGYQVATPNRGESQRDANYPIEMSLTITIPVREAEPVRAPAKAQKPAVAKS